MWQWYLIRPGCLRALEDPLVKKILPRYVKVVEDKKIARFQIVKRVPCKHSIENLGEEKLWKIHDELMKKFYEMMRTLDEGKKKLKEFKIPSRSLLDLKIKLTEEIMKSCELCERKCHVNRLEGELGFCKVGKGCLISSEFIHMGEEPFVTPSHTIFFMGCTFHCQYCQNWSISQWYETGYEISPKELAVRIERRREEGARNVNFVGGEPTPSLLCILKTLNACNANVPVIWNSNFYMSEKTMKILEGIVDMYLSDFKYGNDECALRLSKVSRYFDVCKRNHLIASKTTEITVRHLVLPNHVECCTFPVLEWIASNLKDKCIVNIMDQYTPYWKANEYPEINRRITREEYQKTLEKAEILGLNVKC